MKHQIGGDGEIKSCLMVEERQGVVKNGEGRRVCFPHSACSGRPRRGDCPVKAGKNKAWLSGGRKDLVIFIRRDKQKTKEFAGLCRRGGGIEDASGFLTRLWLKRLRMRGLQKMNFKAKLKALGVRIRRVFSFA